MAVVGIGSGFAGIVMLSIYVCAKTLNRVLWVIAIACAIEIFTGTYINFIFIYTFIYIFFIITLFKYVHYNSQSNILQMYLQSY